MVTALDPSSGTARSISFDGDRNVLLMGGYSPATQVAYCTATHRFLQWCDEHYGGHLSLGGARNYRRLDRALSEYMVELWFDNVGKAEASRTFYGLEMLIPGIKQHLPRAKRSLRGYERLAPSKQRPPMPLPVAAALAVWLAGSGKFSMCLAILLSFECYLRSGEMLRLIRKDFALGTDSRLGFTGGTAASRLFVNIQRAKTGKFQGVEVRDPQVKAITLAYLERLQPEAKVFPFSKSTYYRWFHHGCSALSLSSEYVPHSLRHGAATRDYSDNNVPIADVMVRGRWAATKSALHYIQQGRQLMMAHQVPPHIDALGRLFLGDLRGFIALAQAARRNAQSFPSIRSRRARK